MLRRSWDLRRCLVGVFAILGLVIVTSGVTAQSTSDKDAGPKAVGKPSAIGRTELSAGPISAKFMNTQHGATYAAGDSAFVELRVRSSARRRRGMRSATFEFVAEGGVIRGVSGRHVRTRRDGEAFVAEVGKLRRNKDSVVLIEVRMVRPPGAAPTKVQNTLRVTLRAPKRKTGRASKRKTARTSKRKAARPRRKEAAAPQTTTFVWTVAVCAAGYHQALSDLRQGQVDTLLPALRSVRRKDAVLPGRWLFWGRTGRKRRARRACLRWKRYRRVRGDRVRIVRRCTKWAAKRPAPPVQASPSEPSNDELKLKRFIGAFVADRGAAPEFAREGRFGWVTQRLTYDLRTFTGQPPHPALCSGTPIMLAYFARRAEDLGRRQKEVAEVAAGVGDLLDTRIKAAYEVRKAHKIEIPQTPPVAPPVSGDASGGASSGAPGIRGMTDAKPATLKEPGGTDAAKPIPPLLPPVMLEMPAAPTSGGQLDRQVVYLAGLILPAGTISALRDETDPIVALKMARALLRSDTIKHVPQPVMQATLAAFRMLETAAYVERLQQRYDLLVRPLFASLSAIKTSHAKACVCGQ